MPQLTGSATPDAVGSILIGLLLVVVAVQLINRNRRFLVGEEADPRVRARGPAGAAGPPEVARVTYLRLEVVGPRTIRRHRGIRKVIEEIGGSTKNSVPVIGVEK
jgi:divalent metal cation (Fe/Co/Zn/Cd) transporter